MNLILHAVSIVRARYAEFSALPSSDAKPYPISSEPKTLNLSAIDFNGGDTEQEWFSHFGKLDIAQAVYRLAA